MHGVGVHWYFDHIAPPDITLGTTHHLFPEYFLFATEACSGWNPVDRGVHLGSWDRAEDYAHDIIQVLLLIFNCIQRILNITEGLSLG